MSAAILKESRKQRSLPYCHIATTRRRTPAINIPGTVHLATILSPCAADKESMRNWMRQITLAAKCRMVKSHFLFLQELCIVKKEILCLSDCENI